jgi:plastocyanin
MRAPLTLAVMMLLTALIFPATGAAKAPDEVVEIAEPSEMTAWSYTPVSISVPVGSTVQWKNTGRETHGVTSQDQLFDSKLLDPGKSWSYTFDTPGIYRYFCVPHPWMKGTIIVTSDDSPRQRGSSNSGTSSSGSSTNSTGQPSPTSTPTNDRSSPGDP